jgi:hypothetical protein
MRRFEGFRHFTLSDLVTFAAALLIIAGIIYVAANDARARHSVESRAVSRNTVLIIENRRLIRRIEAEGIERRDQTCTLFEGQHLADVKQLRGTYRFLARLPRSEWDEALPKAIVGNLPQLEAKARRDSAPPYCDEPGAAAEAKGAKPVGLPEPDPKLPKRRDFSYILQR